MYTWGLKTKTPTVQMVRVLCPGHSSPLPFSARPACAAPPRQAACPSVLMPFLKQFEGLELVSRDVFFIDLRKSLNLVNPPILNNLMLRIRNLQDADR